MNPILKLYIPFNQLHGIYSLSPICVPGYRKALDKILYYKNALPCGSPPPLGERLFQKIEWLICPPPLNLIAGCRAMTPPTLPITEWNNYSS